MNKSATLLAAVVAISISSAAYADDAAMDVESMVERTDTQSYQAITPIISGFDIARLGKQKPAQFMATMRSGYDQEYRLKQPINKFESDSKAGLAALLVPQEFAFRSTEQDSSVNAITPGQYVSNSVRSDYVSDTGPAANDKSSIGVKFGF